VVMGSVPTQRCRFSPEVSGYSCSNYDDAEQCGRDCSPRTSYSRTCEDVEIPVSINAVFTPTSAPSQYHLRLKTYYGGGAHFMTKLLESEVIAALDVTGSVGHTQLPLPSYLSDPLIIKAKYGYLSTMLHNS
jgi:hypothetical protein